MRVIAIAGGKGGTSKTTTTWELGRGLVRAGRRVLMIDLDPQSSLTDLSDVNPISGVSASLDTGHLRPEQSK